MGGGVSLLLEGRVCPFPISFSLNDLVGSISNTTHSYIDDYTSHSPFHFDHRPLPDTLEGFSLVSDVEAVSAWSTQLCSAQLQVDSVPVYFSEMKFF